VEYAIVDLFAGPGGLGEGFSAFRAEDGGHPFRIKLSIERDPAAHETLLLRSFLRQFSGSFPDEYYDFISRECAEPEWRKLYPDQWRAAETEAVQLELGNAESRELLAESLDRIREEYGDRIIVIGGPPCQAYSLVGRVRNSGNLGYEASKDGRYFLYQEYAAIVGRLKPAAFIMENVKGILSAKLNDKPVFSEVLKSLRDAAGPDSYTLSSVGAFRSAKRASNLEDGREFIIRSELFGVPQCRHRVIVAGIRRDIAEQQDRVLCSLSASDDAVPTVGQLISGLPKLRSGLSPARDDSADNWAKAIAHESLKVERACAEFPHELAWSVSETLKKCRSALTRKPDLPRTSTSRPRVSKKLSKELHDWISDPRMRGVSNHQARGHMKNDLGRYLFAAAFASAVGRSPKSNEFPVELAPAHKNWKSGKFADRFRVQVHGGPATTVTSHISKDGHANIHPDPMQCRSLTVREAARLQTFPDNYHFKGTRTQQYIQVGNAVPPFLALKIAEVLWRTLDARHKSKKLTASKRRSGETSQDPDAHTVFA